MPTSEGFVLPLLMCFWNSDRDVPIGMPLTDKSLHTEEPEGGKMTLRIQNKTVSAFWNEFWKAYYT